MIRINPLGLIVVLASGSGRRCWNGVMEGVRAGGRWPSLMGESWGTVGVTWLETLSS